MAIPKAGSRRVVVDGERYRWRVRRSPTYMQGAYANALTISIQHEGGGSVLLVVSDKPRPDNWLGRPGAIITPAIVTAVIQKAIESGWKATESGPTFEIAFSTEQSSP